MWKIKKLQNLQTVYILFAVVSILLAYTIISNLPPIFTEYSLETKPESLKISNSQHKIYFFDSNLDGFDEMVRLKTDPNSSYTERGIVVYKSPSKEVKSHQWSLRRPWIEDSFIVANTNNNNLNEFYFFACEHDSLFLYTLEDLSDESEFLEPEFIMEGNFNHTYPEWDIRFCKNMSGDIRLDYDDDGHDDLLFALISGLSQEPRGIYVYSPFLHKIIGSSERFGAYLGVFYMEDIDQDGKKEIVAGSKANDNIDYPIAYSDSLAYLLLFDDDLKFMYDDPPQFSGNLVRAFPVPFQTKGNWNILTAVMYAGTEAKDASVELYDTAWNRIWKEEVPGTKEISIFKVAQENKDNLYYFDFKNTLHRIDENGNELATYKIKNEDFAFPIFYDLNRDNIDEIIFATSEKVWITDESFKPKAIYQAKGCEKIISALYRRLGNEKPQLVIHTDQNLLFFSYDSNPLYYLRALIYLLIFGLIYFFFWSNFAVSRWRLFSRKLIQASADDASRGILRLDTRGRIKYINPTFLNLIEIDHYLQKNEYFTTAFARVDRLIQFIQEMIEKTGDCLIKIDNHTIGLKMKGSIIGKPIKNILGIPFGYLVELRDFSKPIQDDRIKTWSKTVQKMAHDIKTPLSNVAMNIKTLYLKLTDRSPDIADEFENEFGLIQSEMKRITDMSKSFMKFVNLEKPNIQAVYLSEIVEHVREKFHTFFNGDIQFSTDIDEDANLIWADRQQIEMALQILLENAIDAVQGKGHIQLSAQLAQYLEKDFEEYVQINVSDTGSGLPQDLSEKIFEPYYTSKSEGTGIGLAICRKIIEDHSGKIEVSSRVNFATSFRIMLPIRNIEGQES